MLWRTFSCATVAFAAMSLPAFSQFRFGTAGTCDSSGAGTIKVTPPTPQKMAPITGAPYSALSLSYIETLANGAQLTRNQQETARWRDSFGRVRTEIRPLPGEHTPCRSILVQIEDPVAGYLYVLDPVNQVAHAIHLEWAAGPVPNPASAWESDLQPTRSNGPTHVLLEPLGSKTMFGIPVTGSMRTNTFSPIPGLANGKPFSTTCEIWTSPQLEVVVYSKCSDPTGTGGTINTAKDLSTAEPDPLLLHVPAGYKVVEETGPFTITIPSHN
jgi:hypothetical protein